MTGRYDMQKKKVNDKGKQVYESLKLPVVAEQENDVYIITNSMDRLDSLSYKYYGNARYWWVIALANNLGKGTMMVEGGVQLRIPHNPTEVLYKTQSENE